MPLFTILTLFPDALEAYLDVGVVGTALHKGLLDVHCVDFRDWTRDRHRTVDDRPFGGGPGMVLKPEPVVECVEWLEAKYGTHRRLVLDPAGRPFRQADAEALANEPRTLLMCGRYEGFDARIYAELDLEPVSIGDFVLAGGELAALTIVEATARLVPGVLGDARSAVEDSFADGETVDHEHYTRPRVWRGREVPDVLLQGDHQRIAAWRAAQAAERTKARGDADRATPSKPGRNP